MGKKGLYGIIVALGVVFATNSMCKNVYATETGTIVTLSEQVFKEMDADSDVIGNVIMGGTFTLLAAEYDELGNVWYQIQTDTGINGYIPATNVVNIKDLEATAPQQADNNIIQEHQQQAEPEPSEENEAVNMNLDINKAKTVRTSETINIRSDASVDSNIAGRIPRDVVLDCKNIINNELNEIWYEIDYSGIKGYIKASTVEVIEIVSTDDVQQEEVNETETSIITETSIMQDAIPQETQVMNNDETASEITEDDNADSAKSEGFVVEQNNTNVTAKDKGNKFRIDLIVIFSILGSIVCLILIYYFAKKIKRLFKRK